MLADECDTIPVRRPRKRSSIAANLFISASEESLANSIDSLARLHGHQNNFANSFVPGNIRDKLARSETKPALCYASSVICS